MEHGASHWLPRCLGLDTQVSELKYLLPCLTVSGGSPLQWCRWKALPHPDPQQTINPLASTAAASIHHHVHSDFGWANVDTMLTVRVLAAGRSCAPGDKSDCSQTQRPSPWQPMAKVLNEPVEAPGSGIPGGAARCCSGARNSSWYMMVSPPEQAREQVGECLGSAGGICSAWTWGCLKQFR